MAEKEKITYTKSVKRISVRLGCSPVLVGNVLKEFGKELTHVLVENEHFRFASFGSFKVATLPPGKARNPRTGETIEVGERKKVRFTPGTHMMAAICGEEEVDFDPPPEPKPKAAKPKAAKPKAAPEPAAKEEPAPEPAAKEAPAADDDDSFDLEL